MNKWVVRIVRILVGLLFLFSGISGWYSATHNMQGVPPQAMGYTQAIWNVGIFQLVKSTEIIAGLMLIFGFLPWLAAIFLAPIGIGAVVVTALTFPSFIVLPILLCAGLIVLGVAYWPRYKLLFQRK